MVHNIVRTRAAPALGSISEVYLSSVERQPPSSSEVGAASHPLRPGFDLGTPGARGRGLSNALAFLRGKSPLGLGDPPWAASSASDGALNSATWYALVCTTRSRGRELGLDSLSIFWLSAGASCPPLAHLGHQAHTAQAHGRACKRAQALPHGSQCVGIVWGAHGCSQGLPPRGAALAPTTSRGLSPPGGPLKVTTRAGTTCTLVLRLLYSLCGTTPCGHPAH